MANLSKYTSPMDPMGHIPENPETPVNNSFFFWRVLRASSPGLRGPPPKNRTCWTFGISRSPKTIKRIGFHHKVYCFSREFSSSQIGDYNFNSLGLPGECFAPIRGVTPHTSSIFRDMSPSPHVTFHFEEYTPQNKQFARYQEAQTQRETHLPTPVFQVRTVSFRYGRL